MSMKKDMIKLLDSISKFNTYSKYSNSLKKIFKNKTLKDYVKTLKNPVHIDSFQFTTDFDKRTQKIEEEDEFNLMPKGYLKKSKQLNLLNDESIPIPEENKEITKNNFFKNNSVKSLTSFNLSMLRHSQELDPFKYNPNYNSIYKSIPTFKIISPNKKTIKKNPKSELFLTGINAKNKIQNLKNLKINIINENSFNDNKNKKRKNIMIKSTSDNNIKRINYRTLPHLKSFPFNNKNKNKKNSRNNFNNNHAFRFSKYMPRKINIYNVNKRLTYLEPHKYSSSNKNNKAIDFKKMESRDSNRWINFERLVTPSIYYYSPKYDYIDRQPLNILFNPKDFYRNKRKYNIKKILTSFNVKKEYESIDNARLKLKNNNYNIY